MSVPIVSANYQYVALSLATEEASTFHNIYWLYCNAPLNVELPHQIKYEAIDTIKLSSREFYHCDGQLEVISNAVYYSKLTDYCNKN